MPKPTQLVINTSPLLALIAGLGDLAILGELYETVFVTYEVEQEILTGGKLGFGITEFEKASFLQKLDKPLAITPFLFNSLDLGEASVIQLALNLGIATVCIDEAIGRRIARLNSLKVTGSIGILLRAKREGYNFSMQTVITRMLNQGIHLSSSVIQIALKESGEIYQ
jgi:predicted nucleic acid-binding protein